MAKSTECRRCGVEFNATDGRVKYCPDCPNGRWTMKPCAACGGEKPDGKGFRYCPPCQDENRGSAKSGTQHRKRARRYGLTVKQLDELLSIGECQVCKSEKRLVVDHDHVSGYVRGLLCDLCNKALGQARDDVSILAGLIQYLENGNRSC